MKSYVVVNVRPSQIRADISSGKFLYNFEMRHLQTFFLDLIVTMKTLSYKYVNVWDTIYRNISQRCNFRANCLLINRENMQKLMTYLVHYYTGMWRNTECNWPK